MANTRSLLTSLGIIAAAFAATYAPTPGSQQTLVVISGTELQEPLEQLEARFEQDYPNIQLDLKFQGSQDLINNYIDDRHDVDPTVLIPANGELLQDLDERWRSQQNEAPFYDVPQPIAKTVLVGIAWPERGGVLFPNGRFDWDRLRIALEAGNWGAIGGSAEWGSFDFVTTDPTRSNSGQLTLTLWARSQLNRQQLTATALSSNEMQSLVGLVKRSVYLPPRSTDILLQEFITRGPNDADVATVYESIALYRWQQAETTQGKPYQIYYLDPTIETISTAAIVRRNVSSGEADAARRWLDFLTQPEQQAVFIQFGFRPVDDAIDVTAVPGSPWQKNIPGTETDLTVETIPPPDRQSVSELIRQWQRGN